MKNYKFWVLWLLIVIISLGIVWFCFERIPQSPTRDSFLGNLLATVIGIIVGIPIALEINRAQEKSEQAAKELERQKHKKSILRLIKTELEYNRVLLSGIIEKQKEDRTSFLYLGLKNDFWNTLSYGGELQWVDDLDLLDSISTAYYQIRCLIPLDENYVEPGFLLGMVASKGGETTGRTYMGERTVDRATYLRPEALKFVDKALKKIEANLSGSIEKSDR